MSAEDAIREIRQQLDRRLDAAAILLTNALKEEISVPVPRVPSKSAGFKSLKKFGESATVQHDRHGLPQGAYLVSAIHAKTGMAYTKVQQGQYVWYRRSNGKSVKVLRATPQAPPRKFEGRLRASHTWERIGPFVRRVGTNVKYARKHEEGDHPYFMKVLARVKSKIAQLLNQG